MDSLLVAASIVVPLTVALAWAVWFLLVRCRKDRLKHVFRGQGEAVTVAELLEEATEQGEATRLNWSAEDEVSARRWPGMRPYVQDHVGTDFMRPIDRSGDWPTEILPKVDDLGDDDDR